LGHAKPSVPHQLHFGQRFAQNQNRVVAQCQPKRVPRSEIEQGLRSSVHRQKSLAGTDCRIGPPDRKPESSRPRHQGVRRDPSWEATLVVSEPTRSCNLKIPCELYGRPKTRYMPEAIGRGTTVQNSKRKSCPNCELPPPTVDQSNRSRSAARRPTGAPCRRRVRRAREEPIALVKARGIKTGATTATPGSRARRSEGFRVCTGIDTPLAKDMLT